VNVVENVSKTKVAKRKMQNLLTGRTIRQCKMNMFCRDVFGFSARATVGRRVIKSARTGVLNTQSDSMAFREQLRHTVKEFYIRDDVSRTTAGKKENITKHKRKMQKRFVIDSLFKICIANFCLKSQI